MIITDKKIFSLKNLARETGANGSIQSNTMMLILIIESLNDITLKLESVDERLTIIEDNND